MWAVFSFLPDMIMSRVQTSRTRAQNILSFPLLDVTEEEEDKEEYRKGLEGRLLDGDLGRDSPMSKNYS
jgi:hypothetical protein